ncbi:MAG TPA: CsgG/HfaB family protein [Gemmatimonadaceae bacterium]|nr:CsgG/HfaB family protein [Gemmatimonadaceae bacterium]
MSRSLSYATRMFAAAALALPAVALAQADTRPVVVVFSFNNNAIGKDHADYDGMSKGVQDLLITDLAGNSKVRLIDRAKLQDLLAEQNLSKTNVVDQATAIRVGHMLGAQYAITGGFITDGKSKTRLDSHVIDMETSQISNPQTVTGAADDVLGLIAQLSTKVSGGLNLAPKPGAPRKTGETGEAAKTSPTQTGTPAASPAAKAATETYAKPVSEKSMKVKLDVATMKVYSNALDEMDKKNNAKAIELFKVVNAKFPDFEPASNNLRKLSPTKASH